MKRLLLIAALLVASAAPAWAQSDSRWIAIFAPGGTLGKGGDTYGDPNSPAMSHPAYIVETMLKRMGVPYKVILLPDSAGGWARQLGDTRDVDEPDSTHFRKNGCMGWISYMDQFSVATSLKTYTGELRAVFTDADGHRGVQQGSPLDGNWGIPGVVFLGATGPAGAGANLLSGMTASVAPSGHPRNRSLFANGDSISTEVQRAFIRATDADSLNITRIIYSPDQDASNDTIPTLAWQYKTNLLYYSSGMSSVPAVIYQNPVMLMLGVADLLNRAGYVPRRKLNLHIDLDHLFPDATFNRAATDSFLVYFDRYSEWRFGGPIEAHSTELANDYSVTKALMLARKDRLPTHPHSHNYLNFGNADGASGSGWNFSTFADSATKRARWNDMNKALTDTVGARLAAGYDRAATFPNNDVQFPDLYIMAGDGYTDIRSRAFSVASGIDSIGPAKSVNLKRWQQVPGPRVSATANITKGGLPYLYIEPKTNRPLYVHDSVEHPVSSDTAWTSSTDYSVSIEGFASRNLSGLVRMAIFDGGAYWHPDQNLTQAALMDPFLRRFVYFYGRVKNILTVNAVYNPKTPRTGGTSRTTYSDNR